MENRKDSIYEFKKFYVTKIKYSRLTMKVYTLDISITYTQTYKYWRMLHKVLERSQYVNQ